MLSVGRYVLVIYKSSQKLSHMVFDESYLVPRYIRQTYTGNRILNVFLNLFGVPNGFWPSVTMYQMPVVKANATDFVRKFTGNHRCTSYCLVSLPSQKENYPRTGFIHQAFSCHPRYLTISTGNTFSFKFMLFSLISL